MRTDMFLVQASYPLSDYDLDVQDILMFKSVGRKSDASEATYEKGIPGNRGHTWYTTTMEEARRMIRELNTVQGVKAFMREK